MMVPHESTDRTDARASARGAVTSDLAVLAYRSRAVAIPDRVDLDHILLTAQERNRIEGLTGVLIYDQGYFFQWLEGPKLAVMRVWDSIRRDCRHNEFKILRQQSIAARFFKGWDMRLARRTRGEIDGVFAAMDTPQELLTRLRVQPSVLAGGVWDRVFSDVVIPRVKTLHSRAGRAPRAAVTWHAHRGAGFKLAGMLLAADPDGTTRYLDDLVDEGAPVETLYSEIFEPAARCLGGLLEDDRCDDFNVTAALGRLQIEVRRLSTSLVRAQPHVLPRHAILIAPQPGESHGFNATLSSELFYRDGWDVDCEFPPTDAALSGMLHERWYDVLELSLSGAVRRDQQLPAMRVTLRAARAASLNPALSVMVAGRSFFERPRAFLDVGADIACGTSTDAVSVAQRLLMPDHSVAMMSA